MNVYEEVCAFYESYRGEKRSIGKSAEGREIFAFFIGTHDGPQIVSQYAIHAREWITGLIALYHVRRGLVRGGAWVIPLSNPDGAQLSEIGIGSVSDNRRAELVELNGGTDFCLWKANANAVDLNVNFDARWGTGAENLTRKASANYIGPYPFSEPETKALRDFTLEVKPSATVSWHSKGEEIYWEFHQPLRAKRRDKKLAGTLARSTGYPLVKVKKSAGGYKDWCIECLGIPAFTVEVGSDTLTHPIGRNALPALVGHTLDALVDLTNAL